jgi:hypothetical protein
MAAADVAECRDNTKMVRPCANATGGSWLTPSAIADPAPMKISAKVPMNSATSVRVSEFDI